MRIKPWYHVMTALGALLLLGATVFAALRWNTLPEQIPTSFDFAGLPDSYGEKNSLFALLGAGWVMFLVMTVISFFPLGAGWVMFLVMTVISFFPQTWNTGTRRGFLRLRISFISSRQRGPQAIQAMADTLAVLRVIIAAMFSWTCLCIVRGVPVGAWFLPTVFGVLGLDLIVCLVRCQWAGQG